MAYEFACACAGGEGDNSSGKGRAPARARLGTAALILLAAVPLPASAAQPLPERLELSAAQGFVIPVVVQGHSLRLRVVPGVGGIELNADAARAIGLGPRAGHSFHALIGPVRVDGRSLRGRAAIGDWRARVPLRWFDRQLTADADGIIGLSELPHRSTVLNLRPARPGQRPIVLTVAPHEYYGLVYEQLIAGERLRFVFSLHRPDSLATAASGAHLATHFGGTWAGQPFVAPTVLSVPRPLRRLQLSQPLSIGGLPLQDMLVRTGDFRGNFALPEDPGADPSEIVVTGRRGRSRPSLTVAIGADRLGHCSSLRYDRAERRLTLTCDP